MASVNKAIILGNLGGNPDIRYMPSGDAVANMRIATSETWKDKNGEKKEQTEWHTVVAFGRLGEICGQYLEKGSKVYIEGRIQTEKWQDKNGIDRFTTKIIANTLRILSGKKQDATQGAAPHANHGVVTPIRPGSQDFTGIEDDIPF